MDKCPSISFLGDQTKSALIGQFWVMAHIQSSQYYVTYYYYCVIGSSLQKSVVGVAILYIWYN